MRSCVLVAWNGIEDEILTGWGVVGDILFTLADPDNDKEREKEKEKGKDSSSSSGVTLYHKTQGEIERWMKTPHVPGEGEEQALVLSKPLIIPGIDARIPREFGAIVEAAHRGVAGPNNGE